MLKQPMEELLPRANTSIYRLVRMASLRALELSDGKPALMHHALDTKVTTMALEEIRLGLVEIKLPNQKKR